MAVEIQLQVNGGGYGTPGDPAFVTAGDTIDARLTDPVGLAQITWDIIGTNDETVPKPALTVSGNPVGEIASFTTAGAGAQAYGIRARLRDRTGAVTTVTTAVYVNFGNGESPFFIGESFELNDTHGRVPDLNTIISSAIIPIVVTSNPPVAVDAGAPAIGASSEVSPYDHKHQVLTAAPTQGIGGGNDAGIATTLARSDHDHSIRETGGPTNLTVGAIADGEAVVRSGGALVGDVFPVISNILPLNVTKAAASAGVSTEVSRVDHKHDISTAAPTIGIGGGNQEGASISLARADHNHAIRTTAGGGTDLTMGSILDGEVVVRSGTALIGDPRLYGTERHYTERTTSLTTAAIATYLTLVTAALPAGTYRIGWHVLGNKDNLTDDWGVQLLEAPDGINIINPAGGGYFQEEATDAGADQRLPRTGFRQVALTAAVHTFTMNLQSFNVGNASLYFGNIELIRVA